MSTTSRIATNTVFLYLRSFLVLMITLYTSRKVLEILGVVDYGIYNVVGGVVGMMSFLNTSMASSYQRFFNYEMGRNNNAKLADLFKSSLTVQLLYVVLTILVAETLGLFLLEHKLVISPERIDAARLVYHISILSFALTMFHTPFIALIISYERMGIFAYISILEAVLKLAIVYCLNLFDFDKLVLYSLLGLGVIFSNTIIYALVCKHKFSVCELKLNWDKNKLKELANFGGWGMMGSLAITLKNQGMTILLNMFFGTVVNAAQGIANQVMNAVNQFVTNFQTSFRPQIIQLYASGEMDSMYKLYYAATKISFYLIWCISLPIMLNISTILSLWLGKNNVPEYTGIFTIITLLITTISAYANPTSCIAYATGRIKWFTIVVSGLNMLILPVSYIVLRMGAAPQYALVISLIMTIMVQVVRLFVLRRLEQSFSISKYFIKVVLPTIVVAVISTILPLTIKLYVEESTSMALLVAAIAILSVLFSIILLGLTKEERYMLQSKVRQFIYRKPR